MQPANAWALLLVAVAGVSGSTGAAQTPAQELVGHSSNLSNRAATIDINLSDGRTVSIAFRDGTIQVNGESVGTYRPGDALDQAWRGMVSRAGTVSTPELVLAMRSLPLADLPAEAHGDWGALVSALPVVNPADVAEPPDPTTLFQPLPRGPDVAHVRAAAREARETARQIARSVVREPRSSFALGRIFTDVAGLLGGLVALASLGFGAVFFVPQRLEIVAGTVSRSPMRSFMAGLFAQPLILPALVTMIIALVLTLVGILVIPVALVAFVLGLAATIIGGYLAVARVVGEIYVRRRGLAGQYTSGWTTYRYLVYGLIGLLTIWIPAVLLSWIPVAGTILLVLAALFTWSIATAGLGAVVLSRGGLRAANGGEPAALLAAPAMWTASKPTSGATSEARNP